MAASASSKISDGGKARTRYSLVQASAVLGVHRNTLSKYLDQGAPAVTRANRDRGVEWEIDIPDMVDWLVARAVQAAVASYGGEVGRIDREEADRRRAVANAITAEIGADEALRTVTSTHEIQADVAAFCQVLKTGIGNASSRIAARAATMANPSEIEDMAHIELNRAFDTAESELSARWSDERGPGGDDGGEDQPAP